MASGSLGWLVHQGGLHLSSSRCYRLKCGKKGEISGLVTMAIAINSPSRAIYYNLLVFLGRELNLQYLILGPQAKLHQQAMLWRPHKQSKHAKSFQVTHGMRCYDKQQVLILIFVATVTTPTLQQKPFPFDFVPSHLDASGSLGAFNGAGIGTASGAISPCRKILYQL